jgi:replicative DNA helicase
MSESQVTDIASVFSDDAEKGILACIFQNPEELCDDALSCGLEAQFYHAGNKSMLKHALEFYQKDDKVLEIISFSQYLIDIGEMAKLGGPSILPELLNFVPTPTHYPYYKGIVRDKWLLRKMAAVGQSLIARAYEYQERIIEALTLSESEMFELIDEAQSATLRVGGLESAGVTLDRWTDHANEVMKNKGRITGIQTGNNDLDRTLHGIDDKEGECLVLAARPGQGKTAAACSIIDTLIQDQVPTAYFPIEMGTNRTWDRIILGSQGIDTAKSITGMFSRDEIKKMMAYADAAKTAPIYMDNSPSLNTAELRHRVKAAKRKWGIRVLIVDYLGLVDPVTDEGKEQERLALKEVMRTVHYLKRKYSLAVILLVQLSRETDRAPGKAPVLADLAGSADIERYADHVVFIHRPAYFKHWAKLGDDGQEEVDVVFGSRLDATRPLDLIGTLERVVDTAHHGRHRVVGIQRLVRVHGLGRVAVGGHLPPRQIDRLQARFGLLHGLSG